MKKYITNLLSAELVQGVVKVISHFIYVQTALCRCHQVSILTISITIQYHPKITIYRCHYENRPIQIYRKFHLEKLKIFR